MLNDKKTNRFASKLISLSIAVFATRYPNLLLSTKTNFKTRNRCYRGLKDSPTSGSLWFRAVFPLSWPGAGGCSGPHALTGRATSRFGLTESAGPRPPLVARCPAASAAGWGLAATMTGSGLQPHILSPWALQPGSLQGVSGQDW